MSNKEMEYIKTIEEREDEINALRMELEELR